MVVCECERLGVILSVLGGDEHYAISTLVAIKCCGSGILKNLNAFHILCNHILNGTLHTVNKNEWCVTVKRLKAAEIECRILGCINTRTVKADESITLSQYVIADIACSTLVDILCRDDTDGSC